jgi:hypothetical protein
LIAVTVIVVLPELLDLNVSEDGFALMLKLATVRVIGILWSIAPPDAVIVRV